MKIYTKKGDSGVTGLLHGIRVPKSEAVVGALGDLDELNACLGWVVAAGQAAPVREIVVQIQGALFQVGAEVAGGSPSPYAGLVEALETDIDRMELALPTLENFILPGGSEAGSRLHLARAVCRRAERSVSQFVQEDGRKLLNRFSDWLFVAARTANHTAGQNETLWKSQ